ncbi:flagellar biosynthesis regulator FlhF [Neobacillus bataviensis LMG 21833]|uniref:Flagellar biosynthesis protein FlhF n=1 Tax=Neobacillus bataviensis LMG 21833 TaxID=1117379 RepID=K6D6J6_9BACI|nr:flagellar biosynthesis protein FlhF [Neobacillus bataviensis]EKN63673.1 flagellar biosynthesis regulator FlhF [Neobacillus bataviensis LMG 21833]
MKIKRYIVGSLPQAIQQIRQELGENAVILNTKELKTGGILGLFKRKQLEVIAASEEAESKTVKPTEPPEVQKEQTETEVLQRLNQMEKLLEGFVKGQTSTPSKTPSNLTKWRKRLAEQEVDEEVIQYMMKQIMTQHPLIEQQTEQEVGKVVLNTVMKLLHDGIAPEGMDANAALITLIGPTGVGKTTTIAKLASRQVLFQRKKVGFLTADTFRIAAIDQLKTYANILNIPIEVVESPEQLTESLRNLKNCQMIFMDSAGRNYLEGHYIEEINEFLSQASRQENHLVLSMTSRWKDMKQMVEKMKSLQIDRVILTKWDESSCFGAALNLVYHYPIPLSFISLGQGVPEDIMLAEPEYMAKKIVGVDEDEAGSSTEAARIVSAF